MMQDKRSIQTQHHRRLSISSKSLGSRGRRNFSSTTKLGADSINNNGNHKAYIALGSNLGNRIGMIERACSEMNRVGVKVKRTSSLFETAPMYVLDQEPFLNAACEVRLPLPKCKYCSD